ncbi:hypothetical protein [Streptomyces sp. SID1034]|uniref:hypothetical protein n=1 Tax=Streptomyces sp. SID1034 TaxID=2690248 RepID=UPI00136842DB|nr:hypothetical protein [Streptomyces sp. SID1034]MYV90536.1 hypothetical protein [Streptomyces sp. SID1034]
MQDGEGAVEQKVVVLVDPEVTRCELCSLLRTVKGQLGEVRASALVEGTIYWYRSEKSLGTAATMQGVALRR